MTIADRASQIAVTGNTPATRPANNAYFPALDGLRGLAFLMVFAYHYLQLPWGWAGVDVFFVLSGFLITGILFDTRDHPHRVRNFYVRRTLRIFPLYYGIFLVLLLVDPLFHWNWDWGWLVWLAYLGNWLLFFPALVDPAHMTALAGAHLVSLHFPRVELLLGHFWTLCIEEQFYLVWPWLVFGLRDRKRLLWVCAACVVVCPALRVLAVGRLPQPLLASGISCWFTPLRIDALLLGALIALLRRGPHARAMLLTARAGFVLLTAVVLIWLVLNPAARPSLGGGYAYPSWDATWGLSFVEALAACLIVLALEFNSLAFHIFSLRPLRWLGRISYGAYVFHDIPHLMLERVAHHFWVHWWAATAVLAFLFTLLMASASFYGFESRFIGLKERWTR